MKKLILTTALISTLASATAVQAGKYGTPKSGGLSQKFNAAAGKNTSGGQAKSQVKGGHKYQRPAGKTVSPKTISPIFKRAAQGGDSPPPPPPPPPNLRPRGPSFNPK